MFDEKKNGSKFIKIRKLFKIRGNKKILLPREKWQQKPF